jgi:hypothetical protein
MTSILAKMYLIDGFYNALKALKIPDPSPYLSNPYLIQAKEDLQSILTIASAGPKILSLSIDQTLTLLQSLRPSVRDFYSITPLHYINAGPAGISHFCHLINLLINNVNLSTLPQLNSAWAIMLHKGHGKAKNQVRSWRSIATCPLLAKALDKWVISHLKPSWSSVAAPTQFMAKGSSHDLASLLLSEAISHANQGLNLPLFVLLLDKKSAFDSILKEHILFSAFCAQNTPDQSLVNLNNRLTSRLTFVEFYHILMGPIHDVIGVEQGGIGSSDMFQLASDKKLMLTNSSGLGLTMGHISDGAVVQADDVALLSPHLPSLQALLNLSLSFSKDINLQMVPSKTKFLFFPPSSSFPPPPPSSLIMDNLPLSITTSAEHVGVIRSPGTNIPHITNRMASFSKALGPVLSGGLAKGHLGNPAASIRALDLYATPILLTGVPTIPHPP